MSTKIGSVSRGFSLVLGARQSVSMSEYEDQGFAWGEQSTLRNKDHFTFTPERKAKLPNYKWQ